MVENDRVILRDLAKRVAEVAALPVMAERKALWKRHNRLERVRPMILVFPEGAWQELLPESDLRCEAPAARGMERDLRRRLFYHAHLHDDTVIEATWSVGKAVRVGSWGLEPRRIPSTTERGSWAFDPVLLSGEDLRKLRPPCVSFDAEETDRNLSQAGDLFGDFLDVQLRGVRHISYHLMAQYCNLRGLEQALWDMVDRPSLIHDAMAVLEAGHRHILAQYEALDLLDLNNDGTYHSSGGVVEMVLKDTHTCEHRPERFTEWTRIARELAEKF